MSARKQTGRRYGPAPKHDPRPEMQAPAPMSGARRDDIYTNTGRRWRTARQLRHLLRMAVRDKERPLPRLTGKAAATPKQKKVRRA